jgi:tetratricopeptide (TPR) repeat protein
MTKKILLTSILTVFLLAMTFAQERRVVKGNKKYAEYSFSPAIDIYKKVLDKGYVSSDLLEKLGNSYYFNANYEEAEKIYKQLIETYGSEIGPEYFFRFGQTLKTLGDYTNSDSILARFAEMTSNDLRSKIIKTAKDYKEEIARNSGRYDIELFDYNSKYSDFAPAFYKEGLIFSSDRDTGNLARYRHTWNSKDFLDIYKVNADSSSSDKVVKMNMINSRLHESTSVATKDGNTIYFTRNNFVDGKYKKDESGVIRLKIFRINWKDGEWSGLEELPFNSDSYSVAHPALSPDEKTLYFAADMPDSKGESDIYKVSIKEDSTFGVPINLGTPINTESRETFPFVSSENILYFSSDGHPGLGGLDIFATKIDYDDYSKSVLNVGEPVNSKKDDFSYIINEETKKGYFASNRSEGMGADDIYGFLETRPLNFECLQPITGTVRDKISNEVLVGATVKVINEVIREILSEHKPRVICRLRNIYPYLMVSP